MDGWINVERGWLSGRVGQVRAEEQDCHPSPHLAKPQLGVLEAPGAGHGASWLCYLQAGWPQASHLTSLSFMIPVVKKETLGSFLKVRYVRLGKGASSGQCSMHGHVLGKAGLGGQRRTAQPSTFLRFLFLPQCAMRCQLPKRGWQLLCWLLPAGPHPGPNQNRPAPGPAAATHSLSSCLPVPTHQPPLPPSIPLLSSVTSPPLFVFLPDSVPARWRRIKQEPPPHPSLLWQCSQPPPRGPPGLQEALPPCARLRAAPAHPLLTRLSLWGMLPT